MINKTRKFWVTAVAILTAVFLVGCNNLTGVQVDGAKNADGNTASLNAVITNYSDFVKTVAESAGDSARTILPKPREDDDYVFYLSGRTTDGTNKLELTAVTEIPSTGTPAATDKVYIKTESSVTTLSVLALAPGEWEFNLYALPSTATDPADDAGAFAAASLVGYTYSDLRTSSKSDATFTLTSDKLSGKGSIEILCQLEKEGSTTWYGKLADVATSPNFTVTIKDYITNAAIVTNAAIEINSESSASTGVKYERANVPSGTYNFVFEVKDGTSVLQSYAETIIVMPNRLSKGTIVVPNRLKQPPEDVKVFTAVYIKNSVDKSDHIGKYQVRFDWTNNPVTEDYYELQVVDITSETKNTINKFDIGSELDVTDGIYSIYTPSGTTVQTGIPDAKKKVLLKSDEYCSGGLNANNTTVVLYLDLGKRYTARIRAVNAQGPSENWTKVELPDGTVNKTLDQAYETYKGADEAGKAAAEANLHKVKNGGEVFKDQTKDYSGASPADAATMSDVINLFRITYHLNGGSATTSTTSTEVSFNDYPEYFVAQSAANFGVDSKKGYAYWDGKANFTGGTDLKRDGKDIREWVTEEWFVGNADANVKWKSDEDPHPRYLGSANLDLYAQYSPSTNNFSGTVTYETDPAKYKLLTDWIYLNDAALTTGTSFKYKKFGGSETLPAEMQFKVTIPNSDPLPIPEMFDSMKMEVYSGTDLKYVKTINTSAVSFRQPLKTP